MKLDILIRWGGNGQRSHRRNAKSDQDLPRFLGTAEKASAPRFEPANLSRGDFRPAWAERLGQNHDDQVALGAVVRQRGRGLGIWRVGPGRAQKRAHWLLAGRIVLIPVLECRGNAGLLWTAFQ